MQDSVNSYFYYIYWFIFDLKKQIRKSLNSEA